MTIFNTPERQKIYRDIIKKLRLIDDAFFNSCFDGDIACMELLLQIIFGNPQLRVKEVLTQRSVPNLFGRGVRFDAIATDGERIFDVEVQRDDEGADPRRARYNSCMMDARELDKGKDFRELPETYVIFITEHDVWKGNRPLYHVQKSFAETGIAFDDGAHIIYVNAAYQDDTPLGRLMHDFFCEDPNDMHYSVLANRARFFKENERGASTMCKLIEDLVKSDLEHILKAEVAEAEVRGETRGEARGEARGKAHGEEIAFLSSIRNLMKNAGVSAEKAMDLLGIDAMARSKYMSLL